MATYYTKADARAYAAQRLQRSATFDSDRILREAKRSATSVSRFDIFLSHASKDAELILGVKAILEQRGFVVYVDWADDPHADRARVDRETADLLRQRMRQSTSLIWVATEAASNSKWMPWELGYFDGFKPDQVAVMPLVNNPGESFKGQEYLSLYPMVGKDVYNNGRSDVFVEDQGRRWSTLDAFARGTTRWNRYIS